MRINQFVANATGLSRRRADVAIASGRVSINGDIAVPGNSVETTDSVTFDHKPLTFHTTQSIMFYKPAGYVCSRTRQGKAPTIYDLLPLELHHLKTIGRLDKTTSGLLLLTTDGQWAHQLTHPSTHTTKYYRVWLKRPLGPSEMTELNKTGVKLTDGISRLGITAVGKHYEVVLNEGRNRQIRRTFAALGNQVVQLHRYQFGPIKLGSLALGQWKHIELGTLT